MIDKEKTIKELKEALDSLDITNKYRLNLIRAIEYLQEEPVSEDLEDEIKRYCNKNDYTCTDDGVVYTLNEQIVNTARHFSEWQKQQMMKDAVDAKVTARWPLHSSPLYNSYEMYVPYAQHLSEGDKVKLIIINED